MLCVVRLLTALCLLTATISACARAAEPQKAAVTCQSSWPENVNPQDPSHIYPLILSGRSLSGGRVEYYGRFKMYSPINSEKNCFIRQILFSTPPLADDQASGGPKAPKISFQPQHGLFRLRPKNMKVTWNSGEPNPPTTFYTYQVQFYMPDQQNRPEPGSFYAQISVIGYLLQPK